jgi:1-acyl-sn-glycerol-3-phosphate acyltransferase
MDIAKFRQIIENEHGYHTPARRLLLAHHLPGWPPLVFYARVAIAFLKEGLAARRGTLNNERWLQASLNCIEAVESAGGRLTVSGFEGLSSQKGPLVFIANHMSILETILLPSLTLPFNDVTFIIKDELRHYPVIGWVMQALDFIAVYRKNPREDLKIVLNEGQRRIQKGCSVVVFPQATRSTIFDAKHFNTLGVKLARKSGVPVVPVALKTDFHGSGRRVKEIGPIYPERPIYFKFGQPIAVVGNGQAAHRSVVEFISKNLSAWGVDVRTYSE